MDGQSTWSGAHFLVVRTLLSTPVLRIIVSRLYNINNTVKLV